MLKYFLPAVALFSLISCDQQEASVFPVETSITEAVYASVTVQPDSLYQAFAVVNGLLDENLVEEGDVVQKGDVLVQIIKTNPELASKNAFLALQLARENFEGGAAILSGLEEEIKTAKLQFLNDSVNYRRQERLWEQQIGSRSTLESRKLGYEKSEAALEILQNKYQRTQNELETQLKQAENTYRSSLINTTDFSVTSKINGKVYAIHKEPGEIVNASQPLVTLGSADRFLVEMLVDEEDIVRVRPGLTVYLTLDAYPKKIFKAEVYKIYPKKDERNQTFLVEALFEDAPEVLLPGLSGEGNIVVAQREKALVIPRKFLIGNNRVRTEDGIVEVVTGLESIDSVEVKEGITANTKLFPPEE
ncbi:efflux RND transporter periplasmic adaptor subunit [Salinimicrobium sediminilitoris]|uniref:efflux RND transporter periplasmic adaptor subunit n=1 Tax=Salinimicrobium sediminilitoris TaxID=2876715 RepID=UPI001E5A9AD3|nr:HlyD family efflux transporter periplasmic adaptor subunit [Salinimicrobium sediminilitoris]MCC8358994.1 HlyD family efflux transporter periplasmic adaptor subunit [Salinimicrobium sediminilitoris]